MLGYLPLVISYCLGFTSCFTDVYLITVVVSDSPGFGLASQLGGIPGLEALGMGSANFMEMQQRMQRELTGNPELMRNLMDNPAVTQLMSDPNIVRSLFEANPQMRELMEVRYLPFVFN